MDPDRFRHSPSGRIMRSIQGYDAFVPNPLPPDFPIDSGLLRLLSEADQVMGELAGTGRQLPNPHLLISPHVRREAVLSSRIEGTQASLSDLFLFEAAPREQPRVADVREVFNYVQAMEYGLAQLATLPLSLRLVRELHRRLMYRVRGGDEALGEFRERQNWIGRPGCTLDEATYVPPPVPEMHEALGAWERYLHDHEGAPPLIQCGLLHYQFESIHPFLDGNGRVGRLLIILYLCERRRLPQPLLYLSAYFQRHQDEYYDRLLAVSGKGDWTGWLGFFLRGVAAQATDAVESVQRLLALQAGYRQRLQTRRASSRALAVLDLLFRNPYLTITGASAELRMSFRTVQAAVERLQGEGIVEEITGHARNRIYLARELLHVLDPPVGPTG